MKLVRYGTVGQERPRLIDNNGQLRDLSAHVADIRDEALDPQALDMWLEVDGKR